VGTGSSVSNPNARTAKSNLKSAKVVNNAAMTWLASIKGVSPSPIPSASVMAKAVVQRAIVALADAGMEGVHVKCEKDCTTVRYGIMYVTMLA
jgi:hypothetical protein